MSSAPASSGFEVKTVDPGTGRAEALRQAGTGLGKVIENRVLTKPGYGEKRHIEFELPEDVTYRAGDYLAMYVHLIYCYPIVRRLSGATQSSPQSHRECKAGPRVLRSLERATSAFWTFDVFIA